jgi:zinc transport system substrate-binding protein
MNKYFLAFLIIVPFVLCITGCTNSTSIKNQKPVIFVSILPQQYFVERIAGDKYRIEVMIPPGMGHSDYDPTPSQMKELAKAQLFFRIGYIVFEEAWMETIAKNNPQLKIINTSDGCPVLKEEEPFDGETNHSKEANHSAIESHKHNTSGIDPHIWLSPKDVKIQARHYLDALIQNNPSDKDRLTKNYKALIADVNKLDSTLQAELTPLKDRKFMVYHPALTYLAKDYNLHQVSIEYAGKEPTANYLFNLVDLARKDNIKVIFIQKQYDTKNASAIANEIGARLVQFDHMAPDWLDNMYRLGAMLKKEMGE